MRILSIETSCDETAVSVIKGSLSSNIIEVEDNYVLSQIEMHREYGGVYPHMAKREHIKNLPILLDKITRKNEMGKIDALAVTYGPGLSPALWVAVEEAKRLHLNYGIPVYPINHMEGHIYAALTTNIDENKLKMSYPKHGSTALLISGGHTELIHMSEEMNYKKIGETQDDAIGECFDKVARMLGYPYPGGPEISKRAELGRKKNELIREELRLPRPMLSSGDLNFSFSGLKTSVLTKVEKNKIENDEKEVFCMEFENAVTDVLIKKVKEAMYLYNTKNLIVGGGVSANNHIRKSLETLCAEQVKNLYLSEKNLSTDNALMIAVACLRRMQLGHKPTDNINLLRAEPNLSL
jgi:N6-L-threonylcarbamoyladenine synthase